MRCALIGNPSVGKSLIFNQLTGLGVEVSNYPGSTLSLEKGNVCYRRDLVEIIDLPGIYSLEGNSEEETLVSQYLKEKGADVLIAVVDVTRLERNLYLLLQVAEYGMPMIVVLNMMDQAEAAGLEIDIDHLKEMLGVDIVRTAASLGRNIDRIIPKALTAARTSSVTVPYDHHVEAAIRSLDKMFETDRKTALDALSGIGDDADLLEAARTIAEEIEIRHRMTIQQIIAANRHHFAGELCKAAVREVGTTPGPDFDRYLTRAFPGIPLLIAVLAGMLVLVFSVGSVLEELIVGSIQAAAIVPFSALHLPPLIETIGISLIIAVQAGLGIAFPYVFLFYLMISVVEDSGYLTRAAFLMDSTMHRLGMHGGAIIPMVLALGCSVPAVMGARHLKSRRERMIAAFLIVMIPCSARTVILAGVVAHYVGVLAAFSIYAVVFLLVLLTGWLLSRVTPGERFGMIMEMAPLRLPVPKLVAQKSWMRLQEFLFIAMPLLLVGSVILGLFEYSGAMRVFTDAVSPFSEQILGLPGFAITALLFGILRKEMAIETLAILGGSADLGSLLAPAQLYIFALVTVLFIPCVATIAVLARENGYKIAALVSAYTVTLGLVIGSIINFVLKYFG